MTRYHEEQHFHGALTGLLILVMLFVVFVTVMAVFLSRPDDALLAIGPVVVVLIAALISLSHLDVDVTDAGVSIAFRGLWPTRRIAFEDIVGLEVKRYRPLLDYGGWGVRLGSAGWAYTTGGSVGVKIRLRKGIPVLIGSAHPHELEAAIREGVERIAPRMGA